LIDQSVEAENIKDLTLRAAARKRPVAVSRVSTKANGSGICQKGFNGDTPLAFGGSSNLAAGGEKENGDNLVCFTDRDIATRYAIEAIKLVDHYRFRAAMQTATDDKPLQLSGRSANWAAAYYQEGSPKSRERAVLAGPGAP
jgi:hypothetical protein